MDELLSTSRCEQMVVIVQYKDAVKGDVESTNSKVNNKDSLYLGGSVNSFTGKQRKGIRLQVNPIAKRKMSKNDGPLVGPENGSISVS